MMKTHALKFPRSPRRVLQILFTAIILAAMSGIHPAHAAPPTIHYYVDVFFDSSINSGCLDDIDDNTCGLRGAVNLANAGSTSNYHKIHLPAGTYTLSLPGYDDSNVLGDLDIGGTTTFIEGAGMDLTFITQSGSFDRIIDQRGSHSLTLLNLTIQGGNLPTGQGGGGGIRKTSTTLSTLTLDHVRVTDNHVSGGAVGDYGGGILVYNSNLNVTDSNIDNNDAVDGGGLAVHNSYDGPVTTIKQSAIFENYAYPGDGGGIWAEENSRLDLENVTIAENTADDLGNGGGLYIYDNLAADLRHVTIAENWAGGMGDAVYGAYIVHLNAKNSIFSWHFTGDVCYFAPASSLFIASNNHNITNAPDNTWCKLGNWYNTEPLLGELGYYRSITATMPPLAGSPAIDGAAVLAPSVDIDQRGKPRCDGDNGGTIEPEIGAHEVCREGFLPMILDTLPTFILP